MQSGVLYLLKVLGECICKVIWKVLVLILSSIFIYHSPSVYLFVCLFVGVSTSESHQMIFLALCLAEVPSSPQVLYMVLGIEPTIGKTNTLLTLVIFL